MQSNTSSLPSSFCRSRSECTNDFLARKHNKQFRKQCHIIMKHVQSTSSGEPMTGLFVPACTTDIVAEGDFGGGNQVVQCDCDIGLIAMNGGIASNCYPFDLRRTAKQRSIILNAPEEFTVLYSTFLPFSAIVPSSPEKCLRIGVTSNSTVKEVATDLEVSVGDVFVVDIPESDGLWTQGSCPVPRGTILYLVTCRVSRFLKIFGSLLCKKTLFRDFLSGVADLEHVQNGASSSENAVRQLRCLPAENIPGLFVVPDFLTEQEHSSLLALYPPPPPLVENGNGTIIGWERLARRKVVHHHRRFHYGSNKVGDVHDDVQPDPPYFDWMRNRMQNVDSSCRIADYPIPENYVCDQLTVNLYCYNENEKPSGISSHVDAHSSFEDAILIVSVGSYTVMEMRRYDELSELHAAHLVCVPPRSLLIMSGEVRYAWTHCIAERRTDIIADDSPAMHRGTRISLTWRKARVSEHSKATCSCPQLCDAQ